MIRNSQLPATHPHRGREAWEKAQVLWSFENEVPVPAAACRAQGQRQASQELGWHTQAHLASLLLFQLLLKFRAKLLNKAGGAPRNDIWVLVSKSK